MFFNVSINILATLGRDAVETAVVEKLAEATHYIDFVSSVLIKKMDAQKWLQGEGEED